MLFSHIRPTFYIQSYIRSYIQSYIQRYIRSYIRSYIQNKIQSYIRSYIPYIPQAMLFSHPSYDADVLSWRDEHAAQATRCASLRNERRRRLDLLGVRTQVSSIVASMAISAASRLYLGCISAVSRPYLGRISVVSRPYLACT